MRPVTTIETCRSSHRRLVEAVAELSDEDLRLPSLLPRYSRGHVLAHLINKTMAHVLLFDGAIAGEVRQLHPAGHEPDPAADAGADWPQHFVDVELPKRLRDLPGRADHASLPAWLLGRAPGPPPLAPW